VRLVAKEMAPVGSDSGLIITPGNTIRDCPDLDVVMVPGGAGIGKLMDDESVLAFVAEQGARARYVTSVCTGALVLGAAGLLIGYEAATHWLSMELLPLLGARPVNRRVVIDRNRITCGGVTAGIDCALVIAAEIFGEAAAKEIQLMMEYDPRPPFRSGSPDTADPQLVEKVRTARAAMQKKREELVRSAAARLGLG
jgi:cyclohexyl-isocyanide hydratase